MCDPAPEIEPRAPSDGPESGQLLGGRYVLHEVRGRGGFAVVYRALDTRLTTSVAVKLLDAASDEATRRRFDVELLIGARMEHPNLIRIIDRGEHEGRPYAVMPLLQGRPLARRLGRDWRSVAGWARQYFEGMRALHEARVFALAEQRVRLLHRDIKPDNCFLSDDGHLTILDLGLAKSLDPPTEPTTPSKLVGTPAYMAPECISGEPASERSDVYSLGVTFFEMLTGERPYRGNLLQLHAVHVRLAPPPSPRELRPEVPGALAALVQKMMAPLPADRPPTVAAALAQLDSFLRSIGRRRLEPAIPMAPAVVARHPTITRRQTPVASRPRLWPTFVLGGCAAVLLIYVALAGPLRMSQVSDDAARDLAAHVVRDDTGSVAHDVPESRAPDPARRPAAPLTTSRDETPAAPPATSRDEPPAVPPSPPPAAEPAPASKPAKMKAPRGPRRFAQVMARLEPRVRACARATDIAPTPWTVRVRFEPNTRAIDTIRVLKLAADHPFARCVDRLVRAAAPPLDDDHQPNPEYTFLARP